MVRDNSPYLVSVAAETEKYRPRRDVPAEFLNPAPNSTTTILYDFSPRFVIYIERLMKDVTVPPSYDPLTRVHSKDVIISPGSSARIYRPDDIPENTRLPVFVYYHGGAYCQFTPSSKIFHDYLNSVVSEAHVIGVSVGYRLAPEYPIPTCYEDTWDATKWVLSHSAEAGPDPWITQYGDMGRVFLTGDSAGGNFSHNMLAKVSQTCLLNSSTKIEGAILIDPFFSNGTTLDPTVDFLSEGKLGPANPIFYPMGDPDRMRREVVCERMLVCVDKDDELKEVGISYYETLKGSGWEGNVELLETNGGGHVFHLRNPNNEKSIELLKKVASFINQSC